MVQKSLCDVLVDQNAALDEIKLFFKEELCKDCMNVVQTAPLQFACMYLPT